MALFAHNALRVQLERGGVIVAEHGPTGRPRSVSYPNDRAAQAIFRKRSVQLLREGWQLTAADADIGTAVASDRELEAALVDSRDVDELAVYGDWLSERGDPCGELAALRRLPEPDGKAIADLERARGYELFGVWADWQLAMPRVENRLELEWQLGWIDTIHLRRQRGRHATLSDATCVAFALQAPMARFARRLVVHAESQLWALQSAFEHAAYRDTIRELVVRVRAMATVATALPRLVRFEVPSDAAITGHPAVRELAIIAREDARELVLGHWPAVEQLTIRHVDGDASALEPALARLRLDRLPKLAELHIDAGFDDDTLARLAKVVRGFELHSAKR